MLGREVLFVSSDCIAFAISTICNLNIEVSIKIQTDFVAKMSLFCDRDTLLILLQLWRNLSDVFVGVFYFGSFCYDGFLV